MSELLEQLANLSFLAKDLFLRAVVGQDKMNHFLIILNQADEDVKTKVYSGLPQPWIHILKSRNEITAADETEVHTAEREIQALFDEISKTVEEINAYEKEHKKMIKEARAMMKAGAGADFPCVSDQRRGIEAPPLQKEYDSNAEIIDLPDPGDVVLKRSDISECIKNRKSRRKFTKEQLTLKELSYLLWATQGVRKVSSDGKISYRTVPSGGARQPFETYVAVQHVKSITPGVYQYIPFGHKLVHLFSDEKLSETLTQLAWGQTFVGDSAVCFMWSVIPYRSEWRYALEAKKDMLQESGHICQNLYLACESILCGTCAIGAYNQEGLDAYLGLDGEDEFVIYLAPVGKVKE